MLRRYAGDEDGAVTLDWVVLAAGVLILAILVAVLLQDPLEAVIASMNTKFGEVGTAVDGKSF